MYGLGAVVLSHAKVSVAYLFKLDLLLIPACCEFAERCVSG